MQQGVHARAGRVRGESLAPAGGDAAAAKPVDQFGFYVAEDAPVHRLDQETQHRREEKWEAMRANWSRMSTDGALQAKVKDRVRKGIPIEARRYAWPMLINSCKVRDRHPDIYPLLRRREDQLPAKVSDQIARDLDRTLPDHSLFREHGKGGQDAMRRILISYALFDPDVGYCQGMGFIVSVMLVAHLDEVDCFWTFVQLMHDQHFAMQRLYLPGFPMLQQFFYTMEKLIEQFLPRLSKHFASEGVIPAHYATQWFLTLYICQFPTQPHLLMRLLDIFFSEGWKIMFRIALTLLKMEQDQLLAMPMDCILPRLKNLQNDKDPDKVMDSVLRLKLKHKDVFGFFAQYRREHPEVNPDHLFPMDEVSGAKA